MPAEDNFIWLTQTVFSKTKLVATTSLCDCYATFSCLFFVGKSSYNICIVH